MARVPTTAEIQARADELGVDLTVPGARARVGQAIRASWAESERVAHEQQQGPRAELLSESVHRVTGGRLIVRTIWVPDPPAPATDEGEPR